MQNIYNPVIFIITTHQLLLSKPMYPAPSYVHQVIYGECLAGTVVFRRCIDALCSSEKYLMQGPCSVFETFCMPTHVRFLWRTAFLQS